MPSLISSGIQPIYIDTKGVSGLEEILSSCERFTSLHILVDTDTACHCLPLIESVGPLKNADMITVPCGEQSKSLETVGSLVDHLRKAGADRSSLLVNLGGGMVSDLGGFTAAVYMRGIRHVNIPTTLMAMVDAAIGGKTGVNHGGVKNLVGSFHPAQAIFISPSFLGTLPYKELRSGFAEVVKHALVGAGPSLELLPVPDQLTSYDWSDVIQHSVRFKDKVVADDPHDHAGRRRLNFGHTIGHVLEALSFGDGVERLTHGEAIALGMMVETLLSNRLKGLDSDATHRIIHLLQSHFPDLVLPSFSDEWIRLLNGDKKNDAGVFKFALLSKIGEADVNVAVSPRHISEAVSAILSSGGEFNGRA